MTQRESSVDENTARVYREIHIGTQGEDTCNLTVYNLAFPASSRKKALTDGYVRKRDVQ